MQFKDHKPIFLQIAEHICDDILQGTYPEGERLPSVREYAAEVEVNANTLVRSYDWLSQKDIIFNKRGMGYYVSQGAKDNIRQSLREAFFQETLPELVQQMQKLDISVEDVEKVLKDLHGKE
jgi:DNA-binding transcriptional regulator YhcF (GntR family)